MMESEDGRQFVAKEDGHNGGRRLVAAQPVVVAGIGHAAAQHLLILVHALDEGRQKQQELCVLTGGASGLEEVLTGIRGQRPVVVLAAAVDARQRAFRGAGTPDPWRSATFFRNSMVS